MRFYRTPNVTVIGRPTFIEPAHLPVRWAGPSTDSERLAEFAARLCYQSQGNTPEKTTAQYLTHIMEEGHGGALEHANFTLLIEGVSRAASHELVRHRAGFSYSQLSQRFVNSEDVEFVMPVAILGDAALEEAYESDMRLAVMQFEKMAAQLMTRFEWVEPPLRRHKLAFEAARAVLPNGVATKIIATANVRAWRGMLEQRLGEFADREVRRLAVEILSRFREEAPHLFADFELFVAADGGQAGRARYAKV